MGGAKLAIYNEPRTFAELHEFVKRMKHNVAEDEDETVAVLDRDNFEDRTSEMEWTFIQFHADWCRHCKLMSDNWEKLAELYKDHSTVMIASLDCNAADSVNKDLCLKFGVGGLPHIQIFNFGHKVGDYSGKRNIEDLVALVEEYVHPEKYNFSDENL